MWTQKTQTSHLAIECIMDLFHEWDNCVLKTNFKIVSHSFTVINNPFIQQTTVSIYYVSGTGGGEIEG